MNLSAREHQLLQVLVVLAILYLALQVFALGWIAVAQVADVVIIFVAAWALAYLLSPLVSRIDMVTPLNRTLSVVVVYIGIGLVLVILGLLAIPPLVAQLNDLVTRGPEYGERASQLAAGIQAALERLGIRVDLTEFYGTLPRRLGDLAAAYAADILGVVSATAAIFFNVTLVLIIAFLMLIDGDTMWHRFTRALTPELASEAELLRQSADRSFGGFIRGSLILGVIYAVATLLILVPLGVPYAGVLALVSGLTMVIPFFGPIIAMIPVIAVTFVGAPDRLPIVFILVLAVQQVLLNVVGPRIMSRSIGIHPIFVFLALLLGAKLAGFWGVFLAMPVAGILNTFARYAYEVGRGRRARTEARTLIVEREAAASAAAAEARDASAETRRGARGTRGTDLAPKRE
ncbi:MAG TPA: AI-2E family transporter [Candidatus Limnocylindria bacterium]|nr:AI-2E family transporter [Candidatus Limnocylindria bacterium]